MLSRPLTLGYVNNLKGHIHRVNCGFYDNTKTYEHYYVPLVLETIDKVCAGDPRQKQEYIQALTLHYQRDRAGPSFNSVIKEYRGQKIFLDVYEKDYQTVLSLQDYKQKKEKLLKVGAIAPLVRLTETWIKHPDCIGSDRINALRTLEVIYLSCLRPLHVRDLCMSLSNSMPY